MSEIQGIHVHRGTGLKNMDLFSESDAYFVCRIGSIGSSWSEKAYESDGYQIRSNTIDNCLNPEWNAFFSFNLAQDLAQLSSLTNKENEKGLELTLRIYDKDAFIDDFLGIVTVPFPKDGHLDATDFPIDKGKAQKKKHFLFIMCGPWTLNVFSSQY